MNFCIKNHGFCVSNDDLNGNGQGHDMTLKPRGYGEGTQEVATEIRGIELLDMNSDGAKMRNFALQTRSFAFKMMKFALQTMNFAFKMVNFVFNMMNFAFNR